MKFLKAIRNFFRNLFKIIDKKIIVPITKIVVKITDSFNISGKKIENWLSKSNTLLFVSLALSILIFIIIDQKRVDFTKSSAEVLRSQPVTAIYNEEAYVVVGLPEAVDITLIGNKTDLFIAKQSPSYDIRVDLTGLKPGQHKVNIKYNQSNLNLEYMVNPSVATVTIYDKVSETRSLSIDVLNSDKLDSKLIIDSVKVDSDKVIIKGAEHQLKQVATVKALVDINNLVNPEVGTMILKDIPLKAYDENGDVVDVETVPSKISAEVTISSPSKELPIKVIPMGEVTFGKAISSLDVSVNKVTVYGPQNVLDELNYLPLEIDVDGLKSNKETKVELVKPVGIKSMSVTNVTVSITLDTVTEKDIEGVKVISRNLADGYSASAVSASDGVVTVNIKGVESVLEQITADDIIAYVDLTGLKEGTHEIDVVIESTDTRVQYLSKTKKVKVRIMKK